MCLDITLEDQSVKYWTQTDWEGETLQCGGCGDDHGMVCFNVFAKERNGVCHSTRKCITTKSSHEVAKTTWMTSMKARPVTTINCFYQAQFIIKLQR